MNSKRVGSVFRRLLIGAALVVQSLHVVLASPSAHVNEHERVRGDLRENLPSR
jgi:hypothetical protein